MKKAPLPKLSYGEGSMFYNKDGDVVYKKMLCRLDGKRVRRTVTGSTAIECLNRMAEKEKELLMDIECLTKKTDFKEEIYYWLENVKKNTLKKQSWERLESTVRNNILESSIGKKKLQDITSKDIQKMINNMNDGSYAHSSIKKVFDALNDFFRYVSKREKINNPKLSDKEIDIILECMHNCIDEKLIKKLFTLRNEKEMEVYKKLYFLHIQR